MQFLVVGLDGTDAAAMGRRIAARPAHLELMEELRQAGNLWFGAALLDETGKMNGSIYFVDFRNEQELRAWLDRDPYIRGEVWKDVQIRRATVRDPWQFNRPREFYEARSSSSS
jgi:uncharacterized protein YciI